MSRFTLSSSVIWVLSCHAILPFVLATYATETLNDILPLSSPTTFPTLLPSTVLPEERYLYRKDGLTINDAELSTSDITPESTITVWATTDDSTVTASGTATTTTTASLTSTSIVTVAETLGLIMPNPYNDNLYVGLNYTFGFVDVIARPAPTYGSWLRQVQPLLIFPDYTVNVFPSSGTDDPTSSEAVPVGSDGLCGASVENYAISYPFVFTNPGWYMFVVNETYMQANVTEHNQCAYPLVKQKSFFVTQTLSIAAKPTWSPGPSSPVDPYTVFAIVSTSTPSSLPVDPQPTTSKEKLGVAVGVTGGVVGLALIVATMWWVRKKRQMDAEMTAFSRLSAVDREAFLRDNPLSFLNPNRPGRGRNEKYGPGQGGQGAMIQPGTTAYAPIQQQPVWGQPIPGQHHWWAWGSYAPASPAVANQPAMANVGLPQAQLAGYGQPIAYNAWR